MKKLKPEGYKCPYCPVIFPKPESLGGYVTSKHRGKPRPHTATEGLQTEEGEAT